MRADIIYNLSWLGVGIVLAKAQWGQNHFEVAHFCEPHTTHKLKNKEQKFLNINNHHALRDSNESS